MSTSPLVRFYYSIKPLIPRKVQLGIRRILAQKKLKKVGNIWPIDPESGVPPRYFKGWPKGKFALVLTHDVDTPIGYKRCSKLAKIELELGFRSSFNFVPERYDVSLDIIKDLQNKGFEVGVHGLKHDGKLFRSKEIFIERARKINSYLKEWGAVGFRSPAMHHNLEWIHHLNILYDSSTFDTDPFEPQNDGVATIFPFIVAGNNKEDVYVELPYTLPQDHCLFIILQEKDIRIWRQKLDWIISKGGMALINTHPDYMYFGGANKSIDEYSVDIYVQFLEYVSQYSDIMWHVLPKDIAAFWKSLKN